MKSVILLLLMTATSISAQFMGCWRMDDQRILKADSDNKALLFNSDGSITIGKWEADPFSESIKRFAVAWDTGQIFDVEVSLDGNNARGKRKNSANDFKPDFTAIRVNEVTVNLWCDDSGALFVNGKKAMEASFKKAETGRIFVKSGDVITIEMGNKVGPMQLGLECFNGKQKILTASELFYTHKPEKGWNTQQKFEFGYRRPLTEAKRGMTLGEVENPTIAIRQREDEKYQTLYFKYVVR